MRPTKTVFSAVGWLSYGLKHGALGSESNCVSTNYIPCHDNLFDPWESFDCDRVFEKDRPIPDETTWSILRTTYEMAVGDANSTISPISDRDGWKVPIDIKQVTGKGRSIFASNEIKAGAHVWTGTQMATFQDGETYITFLNKLPNDLACDVVLWAYVTVSDRHGNIPVISVELDSASLVNSGGWYDSLDSKDYNGDKDLRKEANDIPNNSNIEFKQGMMDIHASQDIAEGAEILIDYRSIHMSEPGFKYFGIFVDEEAE